DPRIEIPRDDRDPAPGAPERVEQHAKIGGPVDQHRDALGPHELRTGHAFDEDRRVGVAARAIPLERIGWSLVFTAGSFACVSLNDALAVRYTGKRLELDRVALASFTAVSIGHLLGFAA